MGNTNTLVGDEARSLTVAFGLLPTASKCITRAAGGVPTACVTWAGSSLSASISICYLGTAMPCTWPPIHSLPGTWGEISSRMGSLSSHERGPLLHPHAQQIVAIAHTPCDVGQWLPVWKRVRSDKQYNMKFGTRKAYGPFCFNGCSSTIHCVVSNTICPCFVLLLCG